MVCVRNRLHSTTFMTIRGNNSSSLLYYMPRLGVSLGARRCYNAVNIHSVIHIDYMHHTQENSYGSE